MLEIILLILPSTYLISRINYSISHRKNDLAISITPKPSIPETESTSISVFARIYMLMDFLKSNYSPYIKFNCRAGLSD